MREILFRGKSTKSGKWVEGSILKTTLDGTTYNLIFGDNFIRKGLEVEALRHSCVYPETVGQFTGLLDKNGKKIFEGDIVRVISHDYMGFDKIGKVEFKDGCYGVNYFVAHALLRDEWFFHRIGKITEIREHGCSCTMEYTYEVIGNVHDNPELLEGE